MIQFDRYNFRLLVVIWAVLGLCHSGGADAPGGGPISAPDSSSAASTASTPATAVNLLTNGGFEEKGTTELPQGWQIVPAYAGKGLARSDEQTYFSGQTSLLLQPNEKNTSASFGVFQMLKPDDIKGREITISGRLKTEGIGDNTVAILLKTDQENWLPLPKDTGGQFLPFSKTFQIASSIPEAGMLLLISGTQGRVWFDDLAVSEGKAASEATKLVSAPSSAIIPATPVTVKVECFEQKSKGGLPAGWKIVPAYSGKGDAVLDKKNVHTGKYSLVLKPNKKNTAGPFGVFFMLPVNECKGRDLTISGYVATIALDGNPTGILLKTDKEYWVILPNDTGGKFVPFSNTFSIPESIPEASLLLLVNGICGQVWFDDLTITTGGVTTQGSAPNVETSPVDDPYLNRVNTPGWQDSVFIAPDGNDLYVAYLPYVQKDFLDIYFNRISEKDVKSRGPIRPGSHGHLNFETYKSVRKPDGTWGPLTNLNINSNYSLYSAKLSFDGKELYYAIRDYQGNLGGDDIYVSRLQSDGSWGPPVNLGPNINTKFREDTPCLSADGNTLYFARNEGETLGWEIMVSHRVNGKWTLAKKMGPPINEPNPKKTANYQPFITADGKEFYFTRIQQLYQSNLQPDDAWGTPKKVFPQLPVSGHASVTADGRYLYFLSVKDSDDLKREHWTVWYAERRQDGSWAEPRPVD
jgi:hypothetical protein